MEAAPGGTPAVHAALSRAVPVSVVEEPYALATAAAVSGVGLNSKNPPKMRYKKFVKLTGYTYAFNSLTHLEYEDRGMNGNGNQVNLLKLGLKNS